jgi:putative redox protein
MIAHSEWKGNGFFEGRSESGHTIDFDTGAEHAAGPGPMEVVLMGLCGCSSVDVVEILEKKRQGLTGLKVTATASQAEKPPRVFTHIKLTFELRGMLDRKAVEAAVALSAEKYCPIARMLSQAATIEYEIVYNDRETEL